MIYRPQQTQRSNRPLVITLAAILVVSVVGVSVWFLRQQTVTAPHAAASTTLAFSNPAQTAAVGESISSDITVNPGTNQVSIVKLSIQYDGSLLQIPSGAAGFTVNQTAFPQTLQAPSTSCNGTDCTFNATYSISGPTQTIQTATTLGTLHMQALAVTSTSAAQVVFGTTTAAYSTASGDNPSQNILSSTSPLAVTITTAGTTTCQANQSTCSWDSIPDAVSYHYKVIETGSGSVVLESDVTAPKTTATFPSQPGKTYTCTVAAINVCGTGNTGSGTSTCPALTPTPAPSQSPTPTTCAGPGTVSNLHIVCPNCATQGVNQ